MKRHLTSTLVMVPPKHFKFNDETGVDNEFQQTIAISNDEIQQRAMSEFNTMVAKLTAEGIQIIELNSALNSCKSPDAVFPNNWFSTSSEGEIILYAMATENRQTEVNVDLLTTLLLENNFIFNEVKEIGNRSNAQYVEGTGAIIFDHLNNNYYAALSKRCDKNLLNDVTKLTYSDQAITFKTRSTSGSEIYHTNVMLSVGEGFAVVCDDVIIDTDREKVMDSLSIKKDVISISEQQMQNFCGNVLQIENKDGDKFIAMSSSAFAAFTVEQKATLEQHGKLLSFEIPTIETIGGGSVRCMLAEIFLPQKN
jgi:hypothetical protein